MSGMITRRLVLSVFLLGVSMTLSASDSICVLEADEESVRNLLGSAATVNVGRSQVPVPIESDLLKFKVSEGRGQFEFQIGEVNNGRDVDMGLNDYQSWSELDSILFTNNVEVVDHSEVFLISHECLLGQIAVSYIGMKGMKGAPAESRIVLLGFQSDASVLLFGRSFDVYLEALRRMNQTSAE